MAITVEGGVNTTSKGVDELLDAPKKLIEGDIEGAIKSGFDGQRDVKRGLIRSVVGVVAAPLRLLTGNTEKGSDAARRGMQGAVSKHV